jgi:hypothetical protein
MVSMPGLQTATRRAWERCRLGVEGKPPRASASKKLVQVWRVLRKAQPLTRGLPVT